MKHHARLGTVLALALALGTGACGGSGGGGVAAAVPTLTSVAPSDGPATGGTGITLVGSGFGAGSAAVTVGGHPCAGVAVVDDTTLTCSTPAGALGLADVTVTTSVGAATLPDAFTYVNAFRGTYHLTSFSGDALASASFAQWGSIDADGVGSVGGGGAAGNTGGGITLALPFSLAAYTIAAGDRISWTSGPAFVGGISADGRVVAVGQNGGTNPHPGIRLLCRRSGSFSPASLTGSYHACVFLFNGTGDVAMWGSVTFDGIGDTASSLTQNVSGSISGPFAWSTGAYTLAPNGAFTWVFSGEPVVGGVLEGGDLIVFAGSSQATNIQLIGVLIRQSTTASLATLSGPYHDLAMFGRAPAAAPGTTPHWISSTGVANADGAGLLSFGAASINSDGMITTSPGGGSPADYAVAATGALSVQAGSFLGAASPTGDFAVFAGATGTGGPPQFWFLLR